MSGWAEESVERLVELLSEQTCETEFVTKAIHPRNPLAERSGYVHQLLRELTDDEVGEFCEHWTARREGYRVEGKDFAAWKASNILSAGHREAERRELRLERSVSQ